MTTVAVKWPDFAADTQLSGSGINRVTKLYRLPDGGVASGAGDWCNVYRALKWLVDGEHGDCPDFEGSSLLIGRPDGTIWIADDHWPAFPLLNTIAAIGSGGKAAAALMASGKTPKQAVELTCAHDTGTSAPVEVMRVKRK